MYVSFIQEYTLFLLGQVTFTYSNISNKEYKIKLHSITIRKYLIHNKLFLFFNTSVLTRLS